MLERHVEVRERKEAREEKNQEQWGGDRSHVEEAIGSSGEAKQAGTTHR